jgi:hypothetical protein
VKHLRKWFSNPTKPQLGWVINGLLGLSIILLIVLSPGKIALLLNLGIPQLILLTLAVVWLVSLLKE